ncbi:MAG: recA-like protein [Sphingomicrobium sp.]
MSLVAGGAVSSCSDPAQTRPDESLGGDWSLPRPAHPTLSELFAVSSRDGGWAGFLLAQLVPGKPLLWVQERMAILEAGRIHPPGLATPNLIHIEARDARDALWAMEEGVRCVALSAVIGEIWGDPKTLDFTATRRLAVAAERSATPCWLVRLGGTANLSGARMRWRIASAASLANALDPRAPGRPTWDAELFRARGFPPGHWSIAHEEKPGSSGGSADPFRLVAGIGDRALGEVERRAGRLS